MNTSKILNLTHCCIEGHTCAALIKDSFACEVSYKTCSPENWRDVLAKQFQKEEKTGEKPFIFITDLNIPESQKDMPQVQELLDMIHKRGNVMLIDHHVTASWLMEDPRVNAFIDPNAKSASHIVLNTLKANVTSESKRKELGIEKSPKLPKALAPIINTNIHRLGDFDSIVNIMDIIDSGQKGYEHYVYKFRLNKRKFIEEVIAGLESSEQLLDQYNKHRKIVKKKVRKFIKAALNSKLAIMKAFKDENGLICIKVMSPKDSDIKGYDIAHQLSSMPIDYDYVEIVRSYEPHIPVSVFSNKDRANAAEIVSKSGGGGHSGAASYLDKGQTVEKRNDEFVFTQESIKLLAMCDPRKRINISRKFSRLNIKTPQSLAFAY